MAQITRTTKEGEVFSGKPKRVSWERLWAFSGGPFRLEGWPTKNIHTDLPFAQKSGLPYVAASATQYHGYAVELLIDVFGTAWLSHGWMDVKFINLVNANDTLVAKASVLARQEQGGATKFTLDISCENQKGEKALVGQATGVIGQFRTPGPEGYQKRVAELKADPAIQKAVDRPGMSSLEYMVTPELNQQYLYAGEDYNRCYVEETEFGPPVTHPGLILNWSNVTRSPSYVRGGVGREGSLHTQDECFWYNPARLGKKLIVTWPGSVGTYERRGRFYYINEALVVDEDGREIVRRLSRGALVSTPEKPYQKTK
ncbi:MAG: MaoC family dehydratase [Dehalococcoidia bacterium]|nr:MaoC family dehydratase [Dehalococcoidia bacterium]